MQQLLNSAVQLIPQTGTTKTQGSQTGFGGGIDFTKIFKFPAGS
jgi:hypothetical protein